MERKIADSLAAFTISQSALLLVYLPYGLWVTLRGGSMTVVHVYTSVAVLKLFTQPLIDAIENVPPFLQALASVQRIAFFMSSEDKSDNRLISDNELEFESQSDESDGEQKSVSVMKVKDLEYSYDGVRSVFSGVTCEIEQGKLNLVMGG
jgi:ATP-binding cassette subfamily C (CFTR/MRP) protein 1